MPYPTRKPDEGEQQDINEPAGTTPAGEDYEITEGVEQISQRQPETGGDEYDDPATHVLNDPEVPARKGEHVETP